MPSPTTSLETIRLTETTHSSYQAIPSKKQPPSCAEKTDQFVKDLLPTLSYGGYIFSIPTTIICAAFTIVAAATGDSSKAVGDLILGAEILAVEVLGPNALAFTATAVKAAVRTCKEGCAAGKEVFSRSVKPGGLMRMTFWPPFTEFYQKCSEKCNEPLCSDRSPSPVPSSHEWIP